MRVAIVGGGPGGLYLSRLLETTSTASVDLWESSPAARTFGFGVVLSEETMTGIRQVDRVLHDALVPQTARWDDIDIFHDGACTTSTGHRFAAIRRSALLTELARHAEAAGARLHRETVAPPTDTLRADYDLVVAADGVRSGVRGEFGNAFGTKTSLGRSYYLWLGLDRPLPAFTFDIRRTSYGVMQFHGYPYSETDSTVVVEMRDRVWRRFTAAANPAPGREFSERSLPDVLAELDDIFAERLDGARLRSDASRWSRFATITNTAWASGNIVLLGDAAHTAHFSIGSGTKLAMEDAVALTAHLAEQPSVAGALRAFHAERAPIVASTQRAAAASQAWFDEVDRYVDQPRSTFAVNLLTRSRRVTYGNLFERDPAFAGAAHADFLNACAVADPATPPMFTPVRIGALELRNRIVVSPMDMYSAVDGLPGDFHLVHLGSKALGGAGLVMTEMVCISERGRITPGCAGIYTDAQAEKWGSIVDFVHGQTGAKIGLQLGHAGRKGATRVMWEGMDVPLADGWPLVSASPLPYRADSQVPAELTRDELAGIRDDFREAARRGAAAGFDLVEVHAAHGYLLSSFISPLTNRRTDEYGGDVDARLRFPLEVIAAVRAVWPPDRPLTVRISATDWHEGGLGEQDLLAMAKAFERAGVDAIDVSSGQVVPDEAPAFGRSYQTPFADAVKQALGPGSRTSVIAVGAISSWDDVNTILLSGRADLCALGRPHLHDPYWTLHAAAEQSYRGPGAHWPRQFAPGARPPQTGRRDAPRPRLSLDAPATGRRPPRWAPLPPLETTHPGR